jgi:hypothetical protein
VKHHSARRDAATLLHDDALTRRDARAHSLPGRPRRVVLFERGESFDHVGQCVVGRRQ